MRRKAKQRVMATPFSGRNGMGRVSTEQSQSKRTGRDQLGSVEESKKREKRIGRIRRALARQGNYNNGGEKKENTTPSGNYVPAKKPNTTGWIAKTNC